MEGSVRAGKAAIVTAFLLWSVTLTAKRTSGVFFEDSGTKKTPEVFVSADTCMACHNNLISRTGEDVSIFTDWRASMMANSSRDPYWMAAVRREVMDHPGDAAAIEDECSVCHMPMTTFPERAAGRKGRVFDHLPIGRNDNEDARLAADGVSCTVCHQIQPANLGTSESFTGGYVIDVTGGGTRKLFGPFQIDTGRTRVMRSSSGFEPTQAAHVQQSELCATCHTLFTRALAPGAAGVRLPEQMPYLEWKQSAFKDKETCQSCHMPVVPGEMPLTQVLGQPREGLSRHTYRGGNFFMMRMLNRYRADLGVRATPLEMDVAITHTVKHLVEDTARISVACAERVDDTLVADVDIENLAGHKLPTAYPSRRAWIHLTVRDAGGRAVFDSGAFSPDGRIAGNDNDADAATFEPHYTQITNADQVQIYESVMVDPNGRVTTGLMSGVRYAKDNRMLPRGMSKAAATGDIAVVGQAAVDADFLGGRDRVTYRIPLNGTQGPLTVTAELWYQPIGYRWATTLRGYDAPEPRRFISYWESMAGESALMLVKATATAR